MSSARQSRLVAAPVVAVILAACGATAQSAAPSAAESQGFTPRNDANISMAAPIEEQAVLNRGEPAADPDHDGLTRYEFTANGAGFSFSISLDPTAELSGGQETSDALVVTFTAGDSTFVSTAAECAITFVNFSDVVIDGELECEGVPTEGSEDTAEAAGIFAFGP
jgi:hypothetical protein